MPLVAEVTVVVVPLTTELVLSLAATTGARFSAVLDTPFTTVVKFEPDKVVVTAFTAAAVATTPFTVDVSVLVPLLTNVFVVAGTKADWFTHVGTPVALVVSTWLLPALANLPAVIVLPAISAFTIVPSNILALVTAPSLILAVTAVRVAPLPLVMSRSDELKLFPIPEAEVFTESVPSAATDKPVPGFTAPVAEAVAGLTFTV